MAKLAFFVLLLLVAYAAAASGSVNAAAEKDTPRIELSLRKVLPKAEIISVVLPFDQKLGCRPYGTRCDGVINQCCDPYWCTPPIYGWCK
uniref:Ac3 protein n=1 Tax=Allamanda cathartica TaxID=52818 RepID=U5JDW6_ALLCA|nr:alpha amylase inhibitor precursor allatide C3 [Allamanda cathartica]